MELDDLSTEIWIPPDATFNNYYQSAVLIVSYLDSVSALTSKAVKAKEKNLILIREALDAYGEKLSSNISKYGGDIEFFRSTTKLKF